MNDLDKIKAKIKKLFALSKSPNANEAAIALEMAQKLMIEHGIGRNDVGKFEIIEEELKGSGGRKPPRYELYLAASIASSFGCQTAYGGIHLKPGMYERGYIFVGIEHRVRIASFIAEVLLRKLKKARKEYMGKLSRVRIRGNKLKRADDFCFGWCSTVVSKLHTFTNTHEEEFAVDEYVSNLSWGDDLKTINRGSVKKSGISDFRNGRRAATDVQLQHGVEGEEKGDRLLGTVK